MGLSDLKKKFEQQQADRNNGVWREDWDNSAPDPAFDPRESDAVPLGGPKTQDDQSPALMAELSPPPAITAATSSPSVPAINSSAPDVIAALTRPRSLSSVQPGVMPDDPGVLNVHDNPAAVQQEQGILANGPIDKPQLAPRGKGFLHSLAVLTGFAAPDPKPGEQAQPDPTGRQKAAHIADIAGGVGSALAAAGGNLKPAELDLERKKLAISKTQADNEAAYRRTMGDYYSGKNQTTIDVAKIKADPAYLKNQIDAISKGQILEQGADGQFHARPMTQEEMENNPFVKAALDAKQATIEKNKAEKELAHARADEIMNPENPAFKQKTAQIQAQLKMAQQRINISLQGMTRQDRQFGINNYGIDPATGQSPPGTIVENGTPIGKNMVANVKPTSQTRSQSEMAGTILPHIDEMRQLITDMSADGRLGTIAGRWNDFLAGKIGVGPEFARLRDEANLMASGVSRMHVGARGGDKLLEHFKSLIDTSYQDPDVLNAGLDTIESFANEYYQTGKVHYVGEGPGPGSINQPKKDSSVPKPVSDATSSNPGGPPQKIKRAMLDTGSKVMWKGQRARQLSDGSVYDDASGAYLGKVGK